MTLIVTGITIALVAVNMTVKPSRAGDDCLAGPNTAAPQGSHWYYRVDRLIHRECWYLGPERRMNAHQDASPARSSNTMSARPASQTATEARTAEAVGARPEPLRVELAPVEVRMAEGVAAEPVPVEKASGHDADINGSEIEE
jgi:hypothetical protein